MNEIDKYFAELCGIKYSDNGWCKDEDFATWFEYQWTIEKSRKIKWCLENIDD